MHIKRENERGPLRRRPHYDVPRYSADISHMLHAYANNSAVRETVAWEFEKTFII